MALSERDKAELAIFNYFINGGGESGVAGISTFNTTFTAGLPGTITAGSTFVSLASVNTNVLSGNESDQFICSTATGATGNGWITVPFKLSDADLAKIMELTFDYNFVSGGSNVNLSGLDASQTLQLWVYNVGLAKWYQPVNYNSINTLGVPGRVPPITFQTESTKTSNTNQYQIAWIIRNDPAGAFSMNIDCIYFGRQRSIPMGYAGSDWTPYNITVNATSVDPTLPSGASKNAYWRRVGDSMQISMQIGLTGGSGGSAGTGAYIFRMPSGFKIDTNKINQIPGGSGQVSVGHGYVLDGSGITGLIEAIIYADGSNNGFLLFGKYSSATPGNVTTFTVNDTAFSFVGGAGYELSFQIQVPIAGWSSNVGQASGYDGRLVTTILGGVVTGSYAATQQLSFGAPNYDSTGSWNTTNNTYTVPVSGIYEFTMSGWFISSGAAVDVVLYADGVYSRLVGTMLAASVGGRNGGSIEVFLFAGQVCTLLINASVTIADGPNFSIKKLAGAYLPQASDTVCAIYQSQTGQSLANGAIVNFETKVIDTHNAVVTGVGTWLFTAPIRGIYSIKGNLQWSSGVAPGNWNAAVSCSNSALSSLINSNLAIGTVSFEVVGWSGDLPLNAGDTIQILSGNSAGGTLNVSNNVVAITKIRDL